MKHSLTLASASKARQKMLRMAGYGFNIFPADVDEEKIVKNLVNDNNIKKMSLILAQEKAKFISDKFPNNFIIGSDQVLTMNNKIYLKAKNMTEAKERLSELQEKTHELSSAVSVYKNGKELFSYVDEASLTMKNLSEEKISNYCEKAGDVLTNCVGCYALENIGLRLFQHIEGDYFTILGMPLLPLSNFLDSEGFGL